MGEGQAAGYGHEAAVVAAGAHQVAVRSYDGVAELAGSAGGAAVEAAVEDDAGAYACADGEEDHVVIALSFAEAIFPPCLGVGIIVEGDGDGEMSLESPAERIVPEALQVGGGDHHPVAVAYVSGKADAYAGQVLLVYTVAAQERADELCHRRHQPLLILSGMVARIHLVHDPAPVAYQGHGTFCAADVHAAIEAAHGVSA